ncbi:Receptor-type tyrosine-protein phosphatase S [Labeo rohita]|uniref:Receptor-type tyrosine-protein phosphatase S n=1 Tax=Labeo rohita TaxID=84645 RepID=A0ABQ8MTJ7_LABRO|nr:Receptor-type tyrosine-protein phosphatase S [Labeo rohita]
MYKDKRLLSQGLGCLLNHNIHNLLEICNLSAGCHVSDYGLVNEVTGCTGGSVLLPCSCTDPQSTVNTFTWMHHYQNENKWLVVFENDKYKNRLKRFNEKFPTNLSLLISDLRKKDEGFYRCKASQTYTEFRVKIKVQCKCKCQCNRFVNVLSGCDLDQNKPMSEVTGHSGESVSERHTGRVKLLIEISPGNLSLQISNLSEEDQGEYHCSVSSQRHRKITFNQSVYQPINLQNTEKNVQLLNTQEGYRENNHKSHLNLTMICSERNSLCLQDVMFQIMKNKEVTGYTGGSVLLPCSCTDPQSTVKTLTWHHQRENQWTEDRLKLFNKSSPANLSLLISDLKERDEGLYRCELTYSTTYKDIKLKVTGCDLDQNKPTIKVTGHSGESVVLPCSCTELQAKPEQLTWTFTPLNPGINPEEIYPHERSERHTGRVKLLNETSPGNLSLQIVNLSEEDQGEYHCSVSSQRHVSFTLTVQVFILLSVLSVVVLLVVLALIYWKCRGRRDVQKTNNGLVLVCSENEKQCDVSPNSATHRENLKQDENEDEVTYSSVVHVKTASKPAHIQTDITEHSEYASIK